MKSKVTGSLLLGLALMLTLNISARSDRGDRDNNRDRDKDCVESEHHQNNTKTPVKLVGAISVPQAAPGNVLRFDISWVDAIRERYYLAEAGNKAVDIFDAENNLYLGRITGFHGLPGPNDCASPEGMGPNGILVTPDNHLWVADYPGLLKEFDLNNAEPPFNLSPIATINTGAKCRADEVGYDPHDHVIMVGHPAEATPFASLFSTSAPYTHIGDIPFPGADGLEQPLWDPALQRFLIPVQIGTGGYLAVINALTAKVENTYPTPNCNGSGLALGPFQHLLVGCGGGQPLLIMNALNGHILTNIPEIHGADEVWFNPGDDRFYAASSTAPTPVLGVIDAETNSFLQAVPSGPGAHSVAAFAETNHIFVPVGVPTAAIPSDPCTRFGFAANTGCILVYDHESEANEAQQSNNSRGMPGGFGFQQNGR